MVRSIPLPINIGEADYCERNEPELAVAGNVAVTTTVAWLFLREPLGGKQPSSQARMVGRREVLNPQGPEPGEKREYGVPAQGQ